MIQNVKVDIQQITKIIHISDVHIRNLKRHDEYNQVFKRVYDVIDSEKDNNTIVFLGGDIVHAKTDMSPELVHMVQNFFKNCADRCYTILITGNHDTNLNNKNRMDALTPIVNALNHAKLLYLRDSGIYKIANIHFTVMSVFDKPIDYIKANTFTGDYKIALHHGAVDTSVTDTGHKLTNKNVPINLFDGYDLVLLGDIHTPNQILQEYSATQQLPTIAYPGSLICQNYGESLLHGILIWDVPNRTSKFVEIHNDFGYYTLYVEDGQYTISEKLPKNLKLRFKTKNTSTSQIKQILSELQHTYNILETTTQKVQTFTSDNSFDTTKLSLGDVRDIEFQNTLITEYLESINTSLDLIDGVRYVNRKCNSVLQQTEVSRNVVWSPKRFEFSNMFSYGESNVIDFTNMRGNYGVFASNAVGKSSLFESLSYCLFDKCSRASRAEQVLNANSNWFECKFEFTVGSDDYCLTRTGKRLKDGHVRVEVNFTKIVDGTVVNLNGKERSDTNKIIRSYIGTYDDFILTALSVQNNNTGFIDMNQKERKNLLAQFLDVDIFESLYKIANDEIKEVQSVIKSLQKQDLETHISNHKKEVVTLQAKRADLQVSFDDYTNQLKQIDEQIQVLTSQIKPVQTNPGDINTLLQTEKRLVSELQILQSVNTKISTAIDTLNERLSEFDVALQLIDIVEINTQIKVLTENKQKLQDLLVQESKVKTLLQQQELKLQKLRDLQYDESCNFCMNNIFVKDAIHTKEEYKSCSSQLEQINLDIIKLRTEIARGQLYVDQKQQYDNLVDNIKMQKLKLSTETTAYYKNESDITSKTVQLNDIRTNIAIYNEQRDTLESNKQLSEQIIVLQKSVTNITNLHKVCNTNLTTNLVNQTQLQTKIDALRTQITQLHDLEKQFKYYELYMAAVSRDGVPYQLIGKSLPKIETEVNNILSQLVEYQIKFDTDGKNINAYIVYESDRFWPLELSSGMEKFIASIAIRTALVNVSNLPRPTFLVIDEGMGNLDVENLNNMYVMFDYLKTQFSFVIVISHIDAMRDMVDSLIEIHKLNGKSIIQYLS
jgi:DNA repair exonuclease SbcCD ATPase subunit